MENAAAPADNVLSKPTLDVPRGLGTRLTWRRRLERAFYTYVCVCVFFLLAILPTYNCMYVYFCPNKLRSPIILYVSV
jgi:hypothetical protein